MECIAAGRPAVDDLSLPRESWIDDFVWLKPDCEADLICEVSSHIWRARVVQISADRMQLTPSRAWSDVYNDLAASISAQLRGPVPPWGCHPREQWIDISAAGAGEFRDRKRPFHTDEAGFRSPASLCLMHGLSAADSGGANRFMSADLLWARLHTEDPTLAWSLLSYSFRFKSGEETLFAPILRRCGTRTFIAYNEQLIDSAEDRVGEDLLSRFARFLDRIDDHDTLAVTLGPGDAVIWWDNLSIHRRDRVEIGGGARHCRKTGIWLPQGLNGAPSRRPSQVIPVPAKSGERRMVVKGIAEKLLAAKSEGRPLVVGIDGVNASGKTHLARDLAECLQGELGRGAQVVNLDDFHQRRKARYRKQGGAAFYSAYFDLPSLADLLNRIRQHGRLNTVRSTLDPETDEFVLQRHYFVGGDTIVLVEGVFLFREELCALFDYRIFVDVSVAVSLGRTIRRRAGREWFGSVLHKYFERYLSALVEYRARIRPERVADLIVQNDDPDRPCLIAREAVDAEWPIVLLRNPVLA